MKEENKEQETKLSSLWWNKNKQIAYTNLGVESSVTLQYTEYKFLESNKSIYDELLSLEAKIEELRRLQMSIGSICIAEPETMQYARAVDWKIEKSLKELQESYRSLGVKHGLI